MNLLRTSIMKENWYKVALRDELEPSMVVKNYVMFPVINTVVATMGMVWNEIYESI